MKMNKEKFLKSELGSSMIECVKVWDLYLSKIGPIENGFGSDHCQKKLREYANRCQAQWEIFQMAVRQFYGIEYHFTRTDEYFGICSEDENDWLFKEER